MKRKHICHISATLMSRAGSTKRTNAVVKMLSCHGFCVTLVVGRDSEIDSLGKVKNLSIIKIKELTKYIHPKMDLFAFIKLIQILRILKPDVVHTHLAKAGILGRVAAFLNGIKIIVHTVHGPTFSDQMNMVRRNVSFAIERFVALMTDYYVFVGEEIKDFYIKNKISKDFNSLVIRTGRFRQNYEKLFCINDFDNINTRKKYGCGKENFIITTVGRLVPSKRIDHAIHILHYLKIRHIDAKLWIVGEALLAEEKKYKNSLVALVGELKLEKEALFLGYQQAVLEIMAASDVITLCSKYEGLPNVAVEAGIVQRPIVTYQIMGMKELLDKGVNGFVIENNDLCAMKERVYDIAVKSRKYGKIKNYCMNNECMTYSGEEMLKQKLNFYERIL